MLVSGVVFGNDSDTKPPKHFSFGVVPQFDAAYILAAWRPILDKLESETGYKFQLTGSVNIPDFENKLANGIFDFAYMNPYHMVKTSRNEIYKPLARDIERLLYGIIVVRNDSDFHDIRQLDGKYIAFPAPNALAASLMPRAILTSDLKMSIKPIYVQSHSSVYLNVALGRAAAGGGVQKTLQQQSPEIRNALRILYTTPKVAPHPIATHKRIPKTVRMKVLRALLAMGERANGRALLRKIPISKIGVASMKDYLPIQAMELERFSSDSNSDTPTDTMPPVNFTD